MQRIHGAQYAEPQYVGRNRQVIKQSNRESWRESMAEENRANERSNLTSSNKFELLLYRLGSVPGSDAHELYGINVFKVREISTMPPSRRSPDRRRS